MDIFILLTLFHFVDIFYYFFQYDLIALFTEVLCLFVDIVSEHFIITLIYCGRIVSQFCF